MRKYLNYLLILVIATFCLGFLSTDDNLHITACDVGQGDAILVTYRNIQILTDGGPNNNVIDCLSNHMPFWDHEIELVVLTHPQADHYFGLIEVFKRYKVDNYMYNQLDVSTDSYKVLENVVGSSGASMLTPRVGMAIRLGLIYLDVVNPPVGLVSPELNDYSISYYLKFKDFEAIMTGDLTPRMEEEIIKNNLSKPVDYIKIPHHGSKNGLTLDFLNALEPEVAVISVGVKNRYHHPHQEILDMLKNKNIEVLRTDQLEDVEIITDGKDLWTGK